MLFACWFSSFSEVSLTVSMFDYESVISLFVVFDFLHTVSQWFSIPNYVVWFYKLVPCFCICFHCFSLFFISIVACMFVWFAYNKRYTINHTARTSRGKIFHPAIFFLRKRKNVSPREKFFTRWPFFLSGKIFHSLSTFFV